MFTDRNVFTLI